MPVSEQTLRFHPKRSFCGFSTVIQQLRMGSGTDNVNDKETPQSRIMALPQTPTPRPREPPESALPETLLISEKTEPRPMHFEVASGMPASRG